MEFSYVPKTSVQPAVIMHPSKQIQKGTDQVIKTPDFQSVEGTRRLNGPGETRINIEI